MSEQPTITEIPQEFVTRNEAAAADAATEQQRVDAEIDSARVGIEAGYAALTGAGITFESSPATDTATVQEATQTSSEQEIKPTESMPIHNTHRMSGRAYFPDSRPNSDQIRNAASRGFTIGGKEQEKY